MYMKTKIHSILVVITLLFSGLLPQVQAVSPTPDGCYPNFTTAEGCDALSLLTTGAGNTGLGWRSLFSDTAGNFNTAVGAGALVLNNADSNTAVGAAALLLNTTGTENTAIGTAALLYNDAAVNNTATGAFALSSHISGNGNTANGWHALFSDTSGQLNTAIGSAALATNVTGSFNNAFGSGALFNNTGNDNTAIGAGALQDNTTGGENTAIGVSALVNNTTGNNNIAIGYFAGTAQTAGNDNIYIGFNLGGAAGESNACYIKSIFGQTNNLGTTVFIDANHKLGTMTSSKRFKEDIKPVGTASQALFALTPVTFHYKKEIDPAGTPQFGLVAEEVEKVNPDLVVRDKEGKPYSVRYDQVNAMLLNEFLKEHRAFVEEQLKVASQQKEIDALKEELKEQRYLIQKVSDKIDLSQTVTKVARHEP
jgi:hypothetical protein